MSKTLNKFSTKLWNNRGFSLVEVMVAAALLTVTVGGVMMLVSDNTAKNVFRGTVLGTSSCLMEANRILGSLKEKSMERGRVNLNTATSANVAIKTTFPLASDPIGATLLPSSTDASATELFTNVAATDYTTRWPTTQPLYDFSSDLVTQTSPIVRPHLAVMGLMNALQSLYMTNKAQLCGAANGLNFYSSTSAVSNPYPAIFSAPTNLALDEAKEYVKIEPFNLETGNVVGSCPDVDIRPPNADETTYAAKITFPTGLGTTANSSSTLNHPAAGAPVLVVPTSPSTVVTDLGFLVTAKVQFKDRAGRVRECSVQERFLHQMQPANSLNIEANDYLGSDGDIPTAIGGDVNGDNISNPPDFDLDYTTTPPIYQACQNTEDNSNLNLRIAHVRPGSMVMCRNLSVLRPTTSNPMTTYTMGIRQTFYSTELRRTAYYGQNAVADPNANGDESFIAGIYYPGGTYYCPTGAPYDCKGLPSFPLNVPRASHTLTTDYLEYTEGSVPMNQAPVRYYRPLSGLVSRKQSSAYKWQPCERVQICGRDPATAHFVAGSSSDDGGYHLRYTNVPDGCEVNLQVAEVDAAYNIKSTSVQVYFAEKVPGNKLCFTTTTIAGAVAVAPNWFFSCTANAATMPTGFTLPCTFPGPGKAPAEAKCCMDFPFFKTNTRNFIDP